MKAPLDMNPNEMLEEIVRLRGEHEQLRAIAQESTSTAVRLRAENERLAAALEPMTMVAISRWEPANAAKHFEPTIEDAYDAADAIACVAPEDRAMRATKIYSSLMDKHRARVADIAGGGPTS